MSHLVATFSCDVSRLAHRSRRRHEHRLHASTMNANDAPAARNVTTAHRFVASHGGAAATTVASNQRPDRERPRTPAGPGSFDCARRQGQPNHRLPWITPGVLPVELPPCEAQRRTRSVAAFGDAVHRSFGPSYCPWARCGPTKTRQSVAFRPTENPERAHSGRDC